MSKIENIAVLDVRDIQEELAREIDQIKNVGVMITNDKSLLFLKNTKKINIGETLKLPKDEKVKFVMENGSIKIDREYLEGIITPIFILINGKIQFDNDTPNKLLDEKIYSMIVNGEIICTKKLSGLIQSKGTINGEIIDYSSDYKFLDDNIELTNRFLKSLKKDSKLSFRKLLILEDIDKNLLEEKISNIQILEELVVVEEVEEEIAQYIDDYYSVKKTIFPSYGKKVKYLNDDVNIDDISVKKYEDIILYVEGSAQFNFKSTDNFKEYINLIIAEKIISDEKSYDIIKDSIFEDVEISIIEGKSIKNMGKMNLTGVIEETINIQNMGKLVLDENLDYGSFNQNVVSIINYGSIEVPEKKIGLVQEKLEKNFGKLKTSEEAKQMTLEKDKDDILYSNMGELKL